MSAAAAATAAMAVPVNFHPLWTHQFASLRNGRFRGEPMKTQPGPLSKFAGMSSQCFAFQRCHRFMSVLSADGCCGGSIVRQGRAGTPSLQSHFAVAFARRFGAGRFSFRVHGVHCLARH